jgi:oligopeptide/dipeptide ABC transporter ATP-binding protein
LVRSFINSRICAWKLIIADEPTTALDVTIQAQILELMKDLTKRLGVAMIIITHNLGVVARYADRVNVMYAGKIIEMGTAKDIYHHPRHPYTLALLKSVPRMDQPRRDKLDPVEGQPPDLTMLDDGCSFRARCRFRVDKCNQNFPELERIDGKHLSACFEKNSLASVVKVAS